MSWIQFQWSSYIFHYKFCWILFANILPRIFWDCISEENWSIRFLSCKDLGFSIKYILICNIIERCLSPCRTDLVGHMLQISPTTWKCLACCKKEWDLRKQWGIVEMNKHKFYCQIIIKIIVSAPTSSLILVDDPETLSSRFPAYKYPPQCLLSGEYNLWQEISISFFMYLRGCGREV